MDNETLKKINSFTRRSFSPEELYEFPVILCDNDIDRDMERFSDEALNELQKLFIGKTGIFDHDPATSNQNARIFDTSISEDSSRLTKNGEPYKYLKGRAYMVRTDENRSLIAEIDGGIKKEVSISCSASNRRCSVCGSNVGECSHIKGKLCHTILDGITDAYEWSFVAVPAQINAGVAKKYSLSDAETTADPQILAAEEELRRDIRRLAYFNGGKAAADAASLISRDMDAEQLIKLKKSYEGLRVSSDILQLDCGKNGVPDNSEFSMR